MMLHLDLKECYKSHCLQEVLINQACTICKVHGWLLWCVLCVCVCVCVCILLPMSANVSLLQSSQCLRMKEVQNFVLHVQAGKAVTSCQFETQVKLFQYML